MVYLPETEHIHLKTFLSAEPKDDICIYHTAYNKVSVICKQFLPMVQVLVHPSQIYQVFLFLLFLVNAPAALSNRNI